MSPWWDERFEELAANSGRMQPDKNGLYVDSEGRHVPLGFCRGRDGKPVKNKVLVKYHCNRCGADFGTNACLCGEGAASELVEKI